MEPDLNHTGELAVITGASSGIGYELAKQFAKHGFDILVAAEDAGLAEAVQVFKTFGTKVESIQADLSTSEGVENLYAKIKSLQRPVDAIALNAGVGVGGASFDKTSLNEEIRMIHLNVMSVVHLSKLVLKDMLTEGHGRILFTSSIASTMPGPYYSVYAATKAFVQSFAQALREENKDKNITITALMPGPTDTNFFARAHMEDTPAGQNKKDSPADVAEDGYQALMDGRDHVVAGSLKNNLQAGMAKVMPETLAAKTHASSSKPNSPQKR